MKHLTEVINKKAIFCDSCKNLIPKFKEYGSCSCGMNFCKGCIGILTEKELKQVEEQNPGHKITYKNNG